MPSRSGGGSRGGRGRSPSGSNRSKAQGYTLRGKNNRIKYVGITNSPARRASEHKQAGKSGAMKVGRHESRDAEHVASGSPQLGAEQARHTS